MKPEPAPEQIAVSIEQDFESFLRRLGLDTIQDYEFVSQLVGGGTNFTALYRNATRKAVAKFYFVGPGDASVKRFLNEVTNLRESAYLKKALPKVYLTFSSDDGLVRGYLMEFVNGDSLRSCVPDCGFGTGPMGAAVAYRVLWGYHDGVPPYVMHCDLHPENIMFESSMEDWLARKPESSEVRILDFGASFVPMKFGYDETFDPDLWKDFNRRYNGAFYSLAPEFFSSGFYEVAVTPGSFDTWGLGLLLFKVLLGREIDIASSVGDYVEAINQRKLQGEINRQIEKCCDDYYIGVLLQQMLRVNVGERISSFTAASFAGQLYNQNPNLIEKRGESLVRYIRDGCDPEAHLPPHERSNSPY